MKVVQRVQVPEVNWAELRERLARVTAGTDAAFQASEERCAAILRERARKLARVPAQPPPATEVIEVIIFSLADELYGIETKYVREVIRLTQYTPLPSTPDFLLGILNLRGEILAVLDLRKFLGVAAQGPSEHSRVVVLGNHRVEFGLLADATQDVQTLRVDELIAPPETVSGIGREYLRGLTPEALIVLDGAVLLNDARLFIDQSE